MTREWLRQWRDVHVVVYILVLEYYQNLSRFRASILKNSGHPLTTHIVEVKRPSRRTAHAEFTTNLSGAKTLCRRVNQERSE